jgi:hypothetical protein
MLSYHRLDEALSWLQSQTGRAWTDSEVFDLAVYGHISLCAIPPRGSRCAVFVFEPPELVPVVKMRTFGDQLRIPCISERCDLAVLYPCHVWDLWHGGETKTLHVRDQHGMRNAFFQGEEAGEYLWFLAPDGKTPQEISVTRENLRLSRDELTQVLERWRHQGNAQQLPELPGQAPPAIERRASKGRRDDDLSTSERNTLLKLVLGMAMHGFDHDPTGSRSKAPKDIADALAGVGLSVTDDTVRKWLKLAAETVAPKKRE